MHLYVLIGYVCVYSAYSNYGGLRETVASLVSFRWFLVIFELLFFLKAARHCASCGSCDSALDVSGAQGGWELVGWRGREGQDSDGESVSWCF